MRGLEKEGEFVLGGQLLVVVGRIHRLVAASTVAAAPQAAEEEGEELFPGQTHLLLGEAEVVEEAGPEDGAEVAV